MGSVTFARPALPDLIARVTQQIGANLPGLTPQLRRSTVQLLSIVLSQELYQLYAYLDNFAAWFFVSTSEGIYLDRKGHPIGVPRLQGSPADLPVSFVGQNGAPPIPAGVALSTQDGSVSFTLDAQVTITSGAGAGTMLCTTAGSAGNLVAGTVVTLVNAIAGIQAAATVGSGGTLGVDVESDADYSVRILQRMQQTPQSGAGADYVAWAKLVDGVTRCFVYPLSTSGDSAGVVSVAAVFDGRAPGSIIPTSGDLANIANTILPLRPVAAQLEPIALAQDDISIGISGLTVLAGFTSGQAQANILTSLQSLFASTTAGGAIFGDGIPWGTTGGFLGLDDIYEAVKQSGGVKEFDLVAPTADITSATAHIAALGTITYS